MVWEGDDGLDEGDDGYWATGVMRTRQMFLSIDRASHPWGLVRILPALSQNFHLLAMQFPW